MVFFKTILYLNFLANFLDAFKVKSMKHKYIIFRIHQNLERFHHPSLHIYLTSTHWSLFLPDWCPLGGDWL